MLTGLLQKCIQRVSMQTLRKNSSPQSREAWHPIASKNLPDPRQTQMDPNLSPGGNAVTDFNCCKLGTVAWEDVAVVARLQVVASASPTQATFVGLAWLSPTTAVFDVRPGKNRLNCLS